MDPSTSAAATAALVPIEKTQSSYDKNKLAETQLHDKFDEVALILDIEQRKVEEKYNDPYKKQIDSIQELFEKTLGSTFDEPLTLINGFDILIDKLKYYKSKYHASYIKNGRQLNERLPGLMKPLNAVLEEVFVILSKKASTSPDKLEPPPFLQSLAEPADFSCILRSGMKNILQYRDINDVLNILMSSKEIYDNIDLWKDTINHYSGSLVSKLNLPTTQDINAIKVLREQLYYLIFVTNNKPLVPVPLFDTSAKGDKTWESICRQYMYVPVARYWEYGDANMLEYAKNCTPGDVITKSYSSYRDEDKCMIADDIVIPTTGPETNNYTNAKKNYSNALRRSLLPEQTGQNKVVRLHRWNGYNATSPFCPVITKYPINYWNGLYTNGGIQYGVNSRPLQDEYVYCPHCEIFDEKTWTAIYNFLSTPSKDNWTVATKFNIESIEYKDYPTDFFYFTYNKIKYVYVINNKFVEAADMFLSNIGCTNPVLFRDKEIIGKENITKFLELPIIENSNLFMWRYFKDIYKKMKTLKIPPTNMLLLYNPNTN